MGDCFVIRFNTLAVSRTKQHETQIESNQTRGRNKSIDLDRVRNQPQSIQSLQNLIDRQVSSKEISITNKELFILCRMMQTKHKYQICDAGNKILRPPQKKSV